MKIKGKSVSVKNFNKDNTPEWIEKIGQVLLVIGGAGGLVSSLNPTIGTIISLVGIVGKAITKFFGD